VAVNNPVPASQVGFQQFRAIERFFVEGSNECSDRGHSSNYLEFFTDLFSEYIFGFSQIAFSLSIFSSQQWELGPQKWISLGARDEWTVKFFSPSPVLIRQN